MGKYNCCDNINQKNLGCEPVTLNLEGEQQLMTTLDISLPEFKRKLSEFSITTSDFCLFAVSKALILLSQLYTLLSNRAVKRSY